MKQQNCDFSKQVHSDIEHGCEQVQNFFLGLPNYFPSIKLYIYKKIVHCIPIISFKKTSYSTI